MSVDFYRVSINGALATTSVVSELSDCDASGGTAPVCALITRPLPFSDRTAANFPTRVIVAPQNLAQLVEQGTDFELSYVRPLERLGGTLSLRAFVNDLGTYDTRASASAAVVHRAGALVGAFPAAGLPKWHATLQQGYSKEGVRVQFTERFTGSYHRYTSEVVLAPANTAPNRVYTDLYVSKAFKAPFEFEPYFQVDNLFNVPPPELAGAFNPGLAYSTDRSAYDVIGRFFNIGVKVRY
jgi:iron complex outermembrane recepter protein